MTPEEQYEILKQDFILKTEARIHLLNTLKLAHFEQRGVKENLVNAHIESISSYGKLLDVILAVKVKI